MSKKPNNEDKWEFIHRLDSLAIQKQKEEIDKLKYDVELWKLRSDNWQKFCELTRPDLYNENARLKAEVERLRASSFVTAVPVEQYERLRKAGDAMALCIEGDYNYPMPCVQAWNAAKEGKQS